MRGNVGDELCKGIPDTESGFLLGDYAINPSNATFIFTPMVSEQVALAMSKFQLSAGVFPDQWKIAKIAPICMDGLSDIRSNYQPISVLPVISKLFEKLVYDQYYNFLVSNHLLYSQ